MSRKPKYKEGMVVHPGPGERVADVIIIAILVLCMFIAIVPMWHTVMVSLSDGQLVIAHEGILWKWLTGDGSINLAGYERTIDYSDYAILKSYAITLLYVVGNVVFGLVMNVIGAYCIFRQNKLRTFMTLFFVFSLMFNGGTVPTYMVIRTLGMTGTIWSLILPGCTNAMFIMMTMNAYKQVPYSTIESAELDGAGHFTIMFKIPAAPGDGTGDGVYDQHGDPLLEQLVRSEHLRAQQQGDLAAAAVDPSDRGGQMSRSCRRRRRTGTSTW